MVRPFAIEVGASPPSSVVSESSRIVAIPTVAGSASLLSARLEAPRSTHAPAKTAEEKRLRSKRERHGGCFYQETEPDGATDGLQ